MPDVYADVTSADRLTQERLVAAMELRAAEQRQREILETYLAWIDLPGNARLLEVGCGSGAITRVLAGQPGSQRSWPSIPRRCSSQGARAGGPARSRDLPQGRRACARLRGRRLRRGSYLSDPGARTGPGFA